MTSVVPVGKATPPVVVRGPSATRRGIRSKIGSIMLAFAPSRASSARNVPASRSRVTPGRNAACTAAIARSLRRCASAMHASSSAVLVSLAAPTTWAASTMSAPSRRPDRSMAPVCSSTAIRRPAERADHVGQRAGEPLHPLVELGPDGRVRLDVETVGGAAEQVGPRLAGHDDRDRPLEHGEGHVDAAHRLSGGVADVRGVEQDGGLDVLPGHL